MKEIKVTPTKNLPNLKDASKRNSLDIKTSYFDDLSLVDLQNFGKNKKYYLKTFGCQMNVNDSEKISALLEKIAFVRTEVVEEADLILLNTCAVREGAENKVFGFIGALKQQKKDNPDLLIAVCGCMSQEEAVVNTIYEKYPQVDLIFGTHNIHRLPTLLQEATYTKARLTEVWSKQAEVIEGLPVKRDFTHKAWVTIMYGCDRFCTYCIVPYTRGKERSRSKEDILNEVRELIQAGYQEITLLGQNVNSYGLDLENGSSIAELLSEIAEMKIPRLRFTTSNPWNFTDELIDTIAKYDNIMPYIHLPLQSGNDEILKLMGRRHTAKDYLELVEKIKRKIKNYSITTDIIVGFPNESAAQFEDTLKMVNQVEYDGAFTFIYSQRSGTPAAKMNDNVSLEEKKQRLKRLNEVVNEKALKNNERYLHKHVKVLVDGVSKKDSSVLSGYNEQNKVVNFKGNKSLIGKIVEVEITKVNTWSLYGKISS